MPIRIGRWHLELHRRAIYITREPDPNCPDCNASCGGWRPHGFGADWDECHCLGDLHTWRLPLWPWRNYQYSEEPF